MKPKQLIGVYPGTFDPLTFGHLDIIRRGCKLVDKLIIGVTTNPQKAPLLPVRERMAHLRRETEELAKTYAAVIEVEAFDQLLMDFVAARGGHIIIRGLRAVSDFEYEFQMAGMNTALNPNVETVFLMADAKLQAISSKLVKEIAAYGGDIRPFLPAKVADSVARAMKKRRGGG